MHRRAKLTVFGRRLPVEPTELEGWPIAPAAAMTGVSRQTATKWVRRYRTEGLAGLENRTSRLHRSPRSPAADQVAAILAARHELGLGPHRLAPLVGSPRSTICDVLRRHSLSRLRDRDRPSGVPIRHVRERPGELLHTAWFARQGVRIEPVMTDNATTYTRSRDFQAALVDIGPQHPGPRSLTARCA